MRGLGTLLFIAFFLACALSISGLALQKVGATDRMVAELVKQDGWGEGTHWNIEKQYFAAAIIRVRRAIPKSGQHDFGGEMSARVLLVGGVPVKLFDAGGYGLESAGAKQP